MTRLKLLFNLITSFLMLCRQNVPMELSFTSAIKENECKIQISSPRGHVICILPKNKDMNQSSAALPLRVLHTEEFHPSKSFLGSSLEAAEQAVFCGAGDEDRVNKITNRESFFTFRCFVLAMVNQSPEVCIHPADSITTLLV